MLLQYSLHAPRRGQDDIQKLTDKHVADIDHAIKLMRASFDLATARKEKS